MLSNSSLEATQIFENLFWSQPLHNKNAEDPPKSKVKKNNSMERCGRSSQQTTIE